MITAEQILNDWKRQGFEVLQRESRNVWFWDSNQRISLWGKSIDHWSTIWPQLNPELEKLCVSLLFLCVSLGCRRLWILHVKMMNLRPSLWLQPAARGCTFSRRRRHKLASLEKAKPLPSKKVLYPFCDLEPYLDRFCISLYLPLDPRTHLCTCGSCFLFFAVASRSIDRQQFQLFHPSLEDMVRAERLFCSSSSHKIDYHSSAVRMDHVPVLKQPEVRALPENWQLSDGQIDTEWTTFPLFLKVSVINKALVSSLSSFILLKEWNQVQRMERTMKTDGHLSLNTHRFILSSHTFCKTWCACYLSLKRFCSTSNFLVCCNFLGRKLIITGHKD